MKKQKISKKTVKDLVKLVNEHFNDPKNREKLIKDLQESNKRAEEFKKCRIIDMDILQDPFNI